jgi:hypothetical protein
VRSIHPTGARRRTADDLPGPARGVRQRRTGAPPSPAGGRLCRPEDGRWHMLRRGRGSQLRAARAAQDNVRGISMVVPPVLHGWQLRELRSAQLVAQLIGALHRCGLEASSTGRAGLRVSRWRRDAEQPVPDAQPVRSGLGPLVGCHGLGHLQVDLTEWCHGYPVGSRDGTGFDSRCQEELLLAPARTTTRRKPGIFLACITRRRKFHSAVSAI